MKGLPSVEPGTSTRTRRWDAVVVGAALPGLVAAVRLGMQGKRVLVLEEEAVSGRFPGLREPFWMSGAHKEGVLGACLRALGVPLIDQRRIEIDPVAFQVVMPDARIDIGEAPLCVDEWVAWGLAKPEEARALVRALGDAAEAERAALLEAAFVRTGSWLSRSVRRGASPAVDPPATSAKPPRHARGVPGEVESAPPALRAILEAQVRALSLAATAPSAHARARLLGAPLEGGGVVRGSDPWLRGILRRRIESLYGEFRGVPELFRLVSLGGQPGLAPDAGGESGEIWVGRALVLNAPRTALASAVAQDPPDLLAGPRLTHRLHTLHLLVARDLVPEAMASRVILLGGSSSLKRTRDSGLTLRRFACPDDPTQLHLLVSALVDAAEPDLATREAEMIDAVAGLMPFAEGRLAPVQEPEARWDDDSAVEEPASGEGWPGDVEIRAGGKLPVFRLDRAAVAGLGFEGELLLGWRGGDAIAAELG